MRAHTRKSNQPTNRPTNHPTDRMKQEERKKKHTKFNVICVYTRRSNLKRHIECARVNEIERENDREQTRNIKNENTLLSARAREHTHTHQNLVCLFVVFFFVLPSFFPIPFHSLFYYLFMLYCCFS